MLHGAIINLINELKRRGTGAGSDARFTGLVSLDYAAIPARFAITDEALRNCDALYEQPQGQTPPEVLDLVAELDRIENLGEEHHFMSDEPDASALGALVATSYHNWARTLHMLLKLTKERRLALIDLQTRQVFDPRGAVDVEATTDNGTRLPYLTEQLIRDLMKSQAHYGDHIVVVRAEAHFIQALYQRDTLCCVEYRDGGPDRHFQMLTADRDLVPRLITAWLHHGPDAALLSAQQWHRLQF